MAKVPKCKGTLNPKGAKFALWNRMTGSGKPEWIFYDKNWRVVAKRITDKCPSKRIKKVSPMELWAHKYARKKR